MTALGNPKLMSVEYGDSPSKHEVIRTRFMLRLERLTAEMWADAGRSSSDRRILQAAKIASRTLGRLQGELYNSLFTPLMDLIGD